MGCLAAVTSATTYSDKVEARTTKATTKSNTVQVCE